MRRAIVLTVLTLPLAVATARGGLYYSGESYAALPSHWRGFLLDQRRCATSPSSRPRRATRARCA